MHVYIYKLTIHIHTFTLIHQHGSPTFTFQCPSNHLPRDPAAPTCRCAASRTSHGSNPARPWKHGWDRAMDPGLLKSCSCWTSRRCAYDIWGCNFCQWFYDPIRSGWWLGHPSKKYDFVNWDDEIPNIWENNKWQPNHQPEIVKFPENHSFWWQCDQIATHLAHDQYSQNTNFSKSWKFSHHSTLFSITKKH